MSEQIPNDDGNKQTTINDILHIYPIAAARYAEEEENYDDMELIVDTELIQVFVAKSPQPDQPDYITYDDSNTQTTVKDILHIDPIAAARYAEEEENYDDMKLIVDTELIQVFVAKSPQPD